MTRWKVAGIDFAHMHMGDNLRMAARHPDVELVAVCDADPARMVAAREALAIPDDRVYTDVERCLVETRPDVVILCPPTGAHAALVEQVASHGVHVLLEKPFAADLADADRIVAAMQRGGGRLAINWPLYWVAAHRTAKRWIDEGRIGEVLEVHYRGGNRGPLWHVADKAETTPEFVAAEKPRSWFYRRAAGGGSLLDYLGYGTTLGTWLQGGRAPLEVTTVVDQPAGLEVDEHSITVARYAHGLSRFETRWGTFTDPWTEQPQPPCGFAIVGTEGTIASWDYQPQITVQTREHPAVRAVPVDELRAPGRDGVEYFLHCLEHDAPIEGPLSPAVSRIGQRIVDAAVRSAAEKRAVALPE